MHWESKGLKVNTKKTKGNSKRVEKRTIQKQDRSMWSLWKYSYSLLCTKGRNWVHDRRAKINRVTARLAMHFFARKVKEQWKER